MTTSSFHVIAPAFNLPAQSDAESFGAVVWLLMHSSRHNTQPLYALEHTLLPAIHLGQYVLVMEVDAHSGARKPAGYLGWANFSPDAEARYVHNPVAGIKRDDWNSGDRMWFVDFIAPFGHAAKVHSLWEPLFAKASGRFMYHRSYKRGVQVRQFTGAQVIPEEARQWWAQRPILAVTPTPTPAPIR